MTAELLSHPAYSSASPARPTLSRSDTDSCHSHQLMHRYADSLGMPLMCVDLQSGQVISQTERNYLVWLPQDFKEKNKKRARGSQVQSIGSGLIHFSIPLPADQG